jgi:Skp family chaperone for outer membrane proteins
MKTPIKLAFVTGMAALSLLALPAGANNRAGGPAAHPQPANRDPGVNTRQHNQQHRLADGVRSGELTREETQTLRKEQREIRQKERAYKSDGKMTRAERHDLHREQNQAGQNIREEKHDTEQRPKTM